MKEFTGLPLKYSTIHCALLMALCFSLLAAARAETPPCGYDALYVFGDSYSDIGEGYLDGNGPTAVAYLARHLGINLLPATRRANVGSSLDFAISGAGTGKRRGTTIGAAILGVGMQRQADEFRRMVHQGQINFRPKSTLFFIAGGLNDSNLTNAITARNLTTVIRTLYRAGARNFEIALLPTMIPQFSAIGRRLNSTLSLLPSQLRRHMPGSSISISNWGFFFDDVMLRPSSFGISNVSEACAGRALFHEDPTACKDPDTRFFFHEGHPSTAVHRVVGQRLYQELSAQCAARTAIDR